MKRVFDPQLCQHSFASRYNPDFSDSQTGCSYKLAISSRPLSAGLVLFQSFANDKDEIFFLHVPWKYIFRYPPGWWSIFNINQTNPKAIFLVRLRYPNRKLTRKLFHNAFTLWLLHNRQDQTLWLFFVAVPLAIPQCIHSQSCTEDGNENPVLHTIPQQPQTSTLLSGSVA